MSILVLTHSITDAPRKFLMGFTSVIIVCACESLCGTHQHEVKVICEKLRVHI